MKCTSVIQMCAEDTNAGAVNRSSLELHPVT